MSASDKILAEIARKGGGKLLNAVSGRIAKGGAKAAADAPKKTLLGGIAAAAAVRIATRSVPGAIVVGGGILAKKLYDRRHARRSASGKDAPKA